MFRRIIVLSAFAAGLSSVDAGASPGIAPDQPQPAARVEGLLLAQSDEVEIYYDQFGRRVLVDPYTGEVLGVERPRRLERRLDRRQLRREAPRRENRYYLDDPEDMARLRRDRAARYRIAPPIEDYEDAPREIFPDEEDFPEAPRGFSDVPDEEPEVVTRGPVERAPLADTPDVDPGPTIVEGTIEPPAAFGAREDVAALQILLDRRGASPGVIDGHFGSNVDKAIVTYREITGENLKSTDPEGIKKALAASGGEAFISYTITASDAAGPFVASVPSDYGEKAKLDRLSYTSVAEMLAEKFHMDEKYLKALNPEANFGRVGTIIRVANVGQPVSGEVARIIADKGRKQVRAYDAGGELLASYPATIGSDDTPSPTGTHKVSRVAFDPDYTYNPDLNFKQGNNSSILTIPPGPNGPVGSIWIALDKPTYGIHGTPDPSKIGKTESHGCVRLTNWDAQELAKIVKPDVTVEFVE
jgi:lipoprotein-anchoring transpeptidase ErfK/SrfK